MLTVTRTPAQPRSTLRSRRIPCAQPPVDGASAFELTLVPETGGEESHVSIAMRVVYTPTYPEEPPTLAVRALKGLSSAQAAECEAALVEAARSEDRLGTAMVYSLAEEAQVADASLTPPPYPARPHLTPPRRRGWRSATCPRWTCTQR